MSASKSALIVGCGYVGSRLKALLSEHGWKVQGIRRRKSDLSDMLAIDVACEFDLPLTYDVVFYMVSAGMYQPDAYEVAYCKGLVNTLQSLKKSGQKPRVIFVSSTSVFAENQGSEVTESSPVETVPFSKELLLRGEKTLAASDFEFTVIRFSGIYGPDRYHLIDQLRSGKATLKPFEVTSNRIHVDDCAGSLHHLACIDRLKPLYIGSDHEPTSYNKVLLWLASKLEVPPPRMDKESSRSVHMSNKKCCNNELIKSGYRFRYPNFRDGFLSCL